MVDIEKPGSHSKTHLALERVRERIAEAALRAGRRPEDVTLVAVSKTFPATAVVEAITAGQSDFGENRVEEALPKMGEVSDLLASAGCKQQQMRWHLIGHLQSRKAKDVIGYFDLIHSVDSLKLAETISRRITAVSNPTGLQSLQSHGTLKSPISNLQSILLECNISGEESKSGFRVAGWDTDPAVFAAFAREVDQMAALPNLRLCGLMTMAPIVEQVEQARPYFAGMRALRDALRARYPGSAWDHLSMGMSDDFEIAVAEGATLVRIGRAIFGERTP